MERESLAGSKIPVDLAMSQVAKGTRPDFIDPKPSDDVAAMTGWNKLPKLAPLPAPLSDVRPLTVADGGAEAGIATADAGLNGATDSGAPGAAGARDAGAHGGH
jgi:hypothetical protein